MTTKPVLRKVRTPDARDEDNEDQGFAPLTAEQARELRERMPAMSPWWIVGGQLAVGVVGAVLAWAWTANPRVGWSLLYGAWAVALPAALYARALVRGAGANFLFWELVKVGLTVLLLMAAPRVVPGLSWLALLVGVVLATKMYWVAFAWVRRPRQTGN